MTSCEAGRASGWLDFWVVNKSFQVPTVFKDLPANEKLMVCTAHSTDIKSGGIKISTSHLCAFIHRMYVILHIYAMCILLKCRVQQK